MFKLRIGPGALVFWAWSLAAGAAAAAVGRLAVGPWLGPALGGAVYGPPCFLAAAALVYLGIQGIAALLLAAFLASLRDLVVKESDVEARAHRNGRSSPRRWRRERLRRGLGGMIWGFFLGAGAAVALDLGAGAWFGLSPAAGGYAARVLAVPSALLAGLVVGLSGPPSPRMPDR